MEKYFQLFSDVQSSPLKIAKVLTTNPELTVAKEASDVAAQGNTLLLGHMVAESLPGMETT